MLQTFELEDYVISSQPSDDNPSQNVTFYLLTLTATFDQFYDFMGEP